MDFKSGEEPISWFRDRYLEGSLTIKPPYQRKPVWMARQKCHLVESVLLHLPIPEVFVQRATDGQGNSDYSVVDGQQRIRTLLQFVGADETDDQAEYNKFALDKLDTDSPWYGTTFPLLSDLDRRKFFGYQLAVRFVDTDDENELKELFRRLNRYTVPLKPQELRNATYEGPFARLAEKLAEDYSDVLAENRIVTVGAIRRMGDVELMAELLIGTMHGPQGGSAGKIDDYYGEYEDFEDEFPGQRRARRIFESTMDLILDALPDLRDLRWSNKTDYYSLFVAVAALLRQKKVPKSSKKVRTALVAFAENVEEALEDKSLPAGSAVSRYVLAVQRGVNEKTRRADRHSVLLEILKPAFTAG